MATFVPLLSREQVERLPERAREIVGYRKSGLSLNHVQGCPLGCAYCIRHIYELWDQRQPHALMSDAEAVDELVGRRYFQSHATPVQAFNRATDPFLPNAMVARSEPERSRGSVPVRSATQHRRLTGATDVTVLVSPTLDAGDAR